jgi:plastocyanin
MSPRPLGLLALAGLFLVLLLNACVREQVTGPHAKELDSPGLLGAATGSRNYIHTFANAGRYPYHCQYHTTTVDQEAGAVVVVDGAADSAFVSIFEGAYHPSSVAVRPDGQVRWQNFDVGVHHSVTSDYP